MAAHRRVEYVVCTLPQGGESQVNDFPEVGEKWAVFERDSEHPRSRRYREILNELDGLHTKKSADYGTSEDPFANVIASEDWGLPAWVGVMIRLTDKVKRLQALQRNGSLANEAAEDSFRDIAAYSIMALVLYEEYSSTLAGSEPR